MAKVKSRAAEKESHAALKKSHAADLFETIQKTVFCTSGVALHYQHLFYKTLGVKLRR